MRRPGIRATEGRSEGRVEFLLVYALAASGSFLLPSLGPAWVLAAWGAGWMLVYLAVVRARWSDYYETGDFADNFYYLGFLLTLAALAGVLVRLGEMSDDILRTVLGQFGLALVTTIVGLTGRTILLMSRTTPEETEERSGQRVARAFDDFTRSLNRLSAEADSFAATFGQGLRSSLARIEGEVDDFATAAAATRNRLDAVRDGLDTLGGAIVGTASDVRASGQQLAGGLRELGGATGPRLAAVGAQLDDLLRRLRELAELLGSVGRGADAATRQTTELVRNVGRDADAATREMMERLNRVTAELGLALARVATAARQATDGLDGQAGGMADVVRQWKEQADRLAAVHRELVEEAEGSGHAVAQVRREIAAGVEALIAQLRQPSNGYGVAEVGGREVR
jgi:hypothetical protein